MPVLMVSRRDLHEDMRNEGYRRSGQGTVQNSATVASDQRHRSGRLSACQSGRKVLIKIRSIAKNKRQILNNFLEQNY